MYRVIEMYGDFEPWWFLEGWEEDIVATTKLAGLDWNKNPLFIKVEVI